MKILTDEIERLQEVIVKIEIERDYWKQQAFYAHKLHEDMWEDLREERARIATLILKIESLESDK